MFQENLPFERGTTLSGVAEAALVAADYENGENLEGKEYYVSDEDLSVAGVKTRRTSRMIKLRVVRNVSGGLLLPKRIARFQQTGPYLGSRVDGMTFVTNGRGYPIDEYLPATGVPDGHLFYVVVEGPAAVLTPIAGSEFNGDIAVGDKLVALTAATSGATTAGRVAKMNITGSTQTADYTAIIEAAANFIGHALSAKTTGNTNSDILVDVGKW